MSPTVKPVSDVIALTKRGCFARALLYAAHIPDMVKEIATRRLKVVGVVYEDDSAQRTRHTPNSMLYEIRHCLYSLQLQQWSMFESFLIIYKCCEHSPILCLTVFQANTD